MAFDVFSSFVVTFCRVLGSTVVGKHSAVLVGGEGQVGALTEGEEDEPGERFEDAEMYSALGIVARPRPPETIEDKVLSAEAMALRVGGLDVPVGWRDLRLHRKFPAPKPGSIGLVGYGGGFLSFDDTADKESLSTWYVPYAGGTKAMVVAMDPDAEALMLVHGDGYAIVLDKDNGITMRDKSGESWVNLDEGKFEVVAATISLRGNVALGADTTSAIPLMPGPASQPTPSVFFSPV